MSTSISLTWEQPQRHLVEGYEINYSFTIDECGGDEGRIPPVTASISDSSLRSYTILNSSATPVEEDSIYSISLTAINSVGRSEPSNIVMVSTLQAGEFVTCCIIKLMG